MLYVNEYKLIMYLIQFNFIINFEILEMILGLF